FILNSSGIQKCSCGGTVKHDVVLYEEGLDNKTVNGAVNAIADADCIIVAGTSLAVYPAAGFLSYFSGKHFVLINRDPTPADNRAELVIHRNVGEVLSEIEVKSCLYQ
ncbi:MAG: NAD-dependent protein deacylase, partial [Eubacterium sp.]|nr:NAD-dependent protein deacylase [Eubacterium sp.]